MKLNIAKSSVMWFTPKVAANEPTPAVYVGETSLKSVSTQKYLGIIIIIIIIIIRLYSVIIFDKQLRWKSHVSEICKKTSYYLYWINAHYKHMPSAVLKLLVDSLVLLRFGYALPVWGPAISKTSVNRLQRQQNWAVCIVKKLRKFDHVSAHHADLGWLSVEDSIKYRTLIAMRQVYLGNSLLDPPILFGSQHQYSTRCPLTYANTNRCHLSQTQTFFRYQGAKWWNQLPQNIFSEMYCFCKLHVRMYVVATLSHGRTAMPNVFSLNK